MSRIYSNAVTISRVAQSATVVTIKAAANDYGWVIVNDSSSTLYLKFGTAATNADYTYKVPPEGTVESGTTGDAMYGGVITGIWAAAGAGAAQVTRLGFA